MKGKAFPRLLPIAGILAAAAPAGCGRASLIVDAIVGHINLSFGMNGLATVDFGTASRVYRAASAGGGKLLLAGANVNGANLNVALARLTSAGLLDATFGTGGKATALFANGGSDQLNHVVFDSSGNAIAVGQVSSRFGIARYTSAGVIDPAFNGGSVLTTVVAGAVDTAAAAAVQSDGKIVVVGTANASGGNPNFGIARYTASGGLDFSASLDYGLLKPDGALSVAIHTDGSIAVAGYTTPLLTNDKDFAVTRYTSGGGLDTSFNLLGYVTVRVSSLDDVANAVMVQPDGKIVAVGYSTVSGVLDRQSVAVRLTTAGALDATFGTGGITFLNVAFGRDDEALTVAYTAGGILVGGYANNGSHDEMYVARLSSAGALDATFGDGGILQYSSASTASRTLGLFVSGSDIYAMGYGFTGAYNLFAILQITL